MNDPSDQNELCQTFMTYLMGVTQLVRNEFGGSLNGTRVLLPKDAVKWMPQLIERFGVADQVKQQYGRRVLEIPGISFFWQDELSKPFDDDPNA